MTVSMKRDSYSSLAYPDSVNFIRFTESELNDGSYSAVIPNTAACASDWRFYVKHNTADKWDSSDSLITVQQVVTVTLNSPNSGTFKRGDTVYVTWSATGASSTDKMTVSMKRNSYSSLTSPDGVNFIRFTESELNDGSYPAVIPNTAAHASDWRFYVKHNTADKWDSSDYTVTIVKKLSYISVSGSSAVNENSYGDYKATAYFSDNTSQIVTTSATWSENSSYAYMDSYTKGRLRTNAVSSNQSVTVTASYTYNGETKSGYITVTVKNIPIYSVSPSYTTSGGGTWGAILKMSASLSGTTLTLTVTKKDGSTFKTAGNLYFKVGTYESYGVNRCSKYISSGSYSGACTHNLADYTGTYPKNFYARFESGGGGYAWVGSITVTEK